MNRLKEILIFLISLIAYSNAGIIQSKLRNRCSGSHPSSPTGEQYPCYWSLDSEAPRPVYVAFYPQNPQLILPGPLSALAPIKNTFQVMHVEVHVGNTAWSIYAPINKQQEFISRPVSDSMDKVFKKFRLERRKFVCWSKMNDIDIRQYVYDEWKGLYNSADKNCISFVNFLLDKLCGKKLLPHYYFLGKLGKVIGQGRNKVREIRGLDPENNWGWYQYNKDMDPNDWRWHNYERAKKAS